MKRFINIFVLTGILSGIFFLWFLPQTKGEEKTSYLHTTASQEETPPDTKTDSLTKKEAPKRAAESKNFPPPRIPQKKSANIKEKTPNKKLAVKDFSMPLYSRGRPMHMRTPPQEKVDSIYVSTDTTTLLP